jgi:hypothetical protein
MKIIKTVIIDLGLEKFRWNVGEDTCELFDNISGMPNKMKKLDALYYGSRGGRPLYLYFMEEMAKNT